MTIPDRAEKPSPYWTVSLGQASACFLGKTGVNDIVLACRMMAPETKGPAFLSQVHSALVIEAAPGHCGEGDGLWTHRTDLALCVPTADCLPVVLATKNRLALVHAGWRGIVSGVISAAADVLRPSTSLVTAIGPGIGPCCYEVGSDVAERLAAASDHSVVKSRNGGLYGDLGAAATVQLRGLKAETINRLDVCTCCHPELLWSYRRNGAAAGRNLAFAWLAEGHRLGKPPHHGELDA